MLKSSNTFTFLFLKNNMTSTGLPPNFRLNLTGLQKKVASPEKPEEENKQPQQNIQSDAKPNKTIQPRGRLVNTTVARKNLVVQSDSDESDFDLDLESIPVGKEQAEPVKEEVTEEIEAPTVQISQLPELDDEDDDLQMQGQNTKMSLLYDLLLNFDYVDEPSEEWSYRQFIKQFANSEASQENADDDEEYELYDDDDDDGSDDDEYD